MSDVRAPYSTRAQTSRAETSVPSTCSAVGGCRAPVEKSIQLGGHGVSSGASAAMIMIASRTTTPTMASR